MYMPKILLAICLVCAAIEGVSAKDVGVGGLPLSPLLDAISISAAVIILVALCFLLQEEDEGHKHH